MNEGVIRDGANTAAFCELMKFEVKRAREWFAQGVPLIAKVDRAGHRHRTVQSRRPGDFERNRAPELCRAGTAAGHFQGAEIRACGSRRRGEVDGKAEGEMNAAVENPLVQFAPTASQIEMAYSVCRSIARAAAKNFYYGFAVLPPRKRNA